MVCFVVCPRIWGLRIPMTCEGFSSERASEVNPEWNPLTLVKKTIGWKS
jgi:hypothetical protein